MEWMVDFARIVRESTLKRLGQVKAEDRSWRAGAGAWSFAEVLAHLIEVDRWLLERLDGKAVPDVEPHPGTGARMDWDQGIAEFQRLGRERRRRIGRLIGTDLAATAPGGIDGFTLWELTFRRTLDHEIHHRGGLQLMLRYGA